MAKKILVIDDSRTARQQVKLALVESGRHYDVVEAVDGRDGLLKIAANTDAALVICDINMPIMNGLEMLTRLRREQPDTCVPIVVLTTEAQPMLLQKAKEAGAKGWIVKPFKPHTFLAAVRKFVGDA
jgi:two-component system, chemotaxis family, chemotaxis protein CheY